MFSMVMWIYGFYGGKDTPSLRGFSFKFTAMESIDLELGELFDRDAVNVDDEGEDVGVHASGFEEDEAAADGVEGVLSWAWTWSTNGRS